MIPGVPQATTPDGRSSGASLVLMFSLGLWVILMVGGVMLGAHWQAEETQVRASDLEHDDRLSCERLGLAAGSSGFAGCAAELDRVRRRHEDRLQAGNSSLL